MNHNGRQKLRFSALVPEIAEYIAFKAKWDVFEEFGYELHPPLAVSIAREDASRLRDIRRRLEDLRMLDPEDAGVMEEELLARGIPLVDLEEFAMLNGTENPVKS